MSGWKLGLLFSLLAAAVWAQPPRRISEDRDLIEIDLSKWDCLNQLAGSAKTTDGAERNRGKNRSPIDLSRIAVPGFDTGGLLKHVSLFDSQTKGKRRSDLTPPQKTLLASLEKQVVSVTGYLVLAYAGPPESTNCGSVDFHDWHLEVFAQPADHSPRIGDPTPIICEIAPRTQNGLFRDNVRLRSLAAFMRKPDMSYEATGAKVQRIRLTGYLLWDDDHNGSADIGPRIQSGGEGKYHHPWRSTAWEIHPVLKIEALDSSPLPPPAAAAVAVPATTAASPPSSQPPPRAPTQPTVTIVEPVTIKIPYGETVLPRGMKLELISRDAQAVTVRYMGAPVKVPLQSTDLR